MSRKPDERIEQAKKLYDKGIKLVEIASQLNVPAGTVRRWKSVYNWDNERSEKKSERSDRIANARKEKMERNKKKKEAVVEEVIDVIENPELTDKQRLFCCLYVKCFNATKAYQKAYQCDEYTAMASGSRMLRNVKVKEEIHRLKQHRLNREMLSEADIFQKYMDIAFSDITDYMEFGREEVPVMGPFGPVTVEEEDGEKRTLTKEINSVRFKESSEVDGTLISEVKQGRDGVSIKLLDKMKAFDWLTDHMDMATEEQRTKVAYLKARTDKLTGSNQEIEDMDEIEGDIYGGYGD